MQLYKFTKLNKICRIIIIGSRKIKSKVSKIQSIRLSIYVNSVIHIRGLDDVHDSWWVNKGKTHVHVVS